jgi:hypothetical protein
MNRNELKKGLSETQRESESIAHTIAKQLQKRIEFLEKNKKLMENSPMTLNQYLIMMAQLQLIADVQQIRGHVNILIEKQVLK